MNGDIPQPDFFLALRVADTEIDLFCGAEVRGQAADQQIVSDRNGALHVSASRRRIFTDADALFHGALQKRVTHYHQQRTFASQFADAFCNRDHFAEPRAALITCKEMLLDDSFFGICKQREPVIRKDCRINWLRVQAGRK